MKNLIVTKGVRYHIGDYIAVLYEQVSCLYVAYIYEETTLKLVTSTYVKESEALTEAIDHIKNFSSLNIMLKK